MNILKGERVKRGLTQKDVAIEIGVSPMTYHRKENGIRLFNTDEIIKISNFLDFNEKEVNEIFFANKITKCNTEIIR